MFSILLKVGNIKVDSLGSENLTLSASIETQVDWFTVVTHEGGHTAYS